MESAWCFRDVILFGRTLLVSRRIFALFVCLVIHGCYVPVSNTYWVGEGTPEFEQDWTICLEELEEHIEALRTQEAEGYISMEDCMRKKGWSQAREKKWKPIY